MIELAPLIAGFVVGFGSRSASQHGLARCSRTLLIALCLGVAISGLAGEWLEHPWLAILDASTALLGTLLGTLASYRWTFHRLVED